MRLEERPHAGGWWLWSPPSPKNPGLCCGRAWAATKPGPESLSPESWFPQLGNGI